jgi:hypothetical protein
MMWDTQLRHPDQTNIVVTTMEAVAIFESVIGPTATVIYRLGCEVETRPGNLLSNPDMEAPSTFGNVFGWGLSMHDNQRDPRAAVHADTRRPAHGRMALRLVVPTAEPLILPVSNAGATPAGCSDGAQGFQFATAGVRYDISLMARSSAPAMSLALMSGSWIRYNSNYSGTAIANVTATSTWMRINASVIVKDPAISCFQIQVRGAIGMLWLDDFYVTKSNATSRRRARSLYKSDEHDAASAETLQTARPLLKVDDSPQQQQQQTDNSRTRHCIPYCNVSLYTLWTHSVPAPAGFTTTGPHVFNTSRLDAIATITIASGTPSGADTFVQVRGFFNTRPDGSSWVVFRYAPTRLGNHVVSFSVNGQPPGDSCGSNCMFTAVANPAPDAGYVQVGPNRQHFVSSGANKSYFGIGENLAWTGVSETPGGNWEPYLQNLSAAGANYIRVWLTDSFDDLFLENKLGNYSLSHAQNIDNVLKLAETYHIKVLMCTESFNFFCTKPKPTPCWWDKCVYNEENGGFLTGPAEFFTNERAKSMYKQRLQYLVSRYSHSPAVFAWEFFNEADITDGFTSSGFAQWTQEMAQFVRSIDIYRHPISTSFCCHEPAPVWKLPEMDFVMVHTYSRHNATDMADNSQYSTVSTAKQFSKPTYVAETGEKTAFDNYSFPADPTGIGLHNALWASMHSMGAMSSAVWWWDQWVAPLSLYHHFTAVRKFADSVNWPAYIWKPIGIDAPPQCTDKNPDSHIPPKYTCEFQAKAGKCDGNPNGTNPWSECPIIVLRPT